MKLKLKDKPRVFYPKGDRKIKISDFGDIELLPDEQLTFVTNSKKRHDFVSKNWGFYATPSINHRLKKEGFKTALVKNLKGNLYIMVIENDKLDLFEEYCKSEDQIVIEWLDERVIS
tara:strand:+ start:1625 stop:1975 length:351 start_codon:yes stop_codon:yes gene_type:complete